MTKAIGIIPARYGSTRFPGKPLAMIAGRPMIQWVVEGARKSQTLHKIVVATDDERIEKAARAVDCPVVMTPSDLPTGTDRILSAWSKLETQGEKADVVLNVQGDEPLVDGRILDQLVAAFVDPSIQMATLSTRLDEDSLKSDMSAKIVLDRNHNAIYFSRLPIPFTRVKPNEASDLAWSAVVRHIGIYAFRPSFLAEFCAQAPTQIEILEGLEQLRALYLGAKIRVVLTDHPCQAVDTPGDVEKIEQIMRARGGRR